MFVVRWQVFNGKGISTVATAIALTAQSTTTKHITAAVDVEIQKLNHN